MPGSRLHDPLPLASALTRRTHRLCLGLEGGEAEILERVTPTTATLLRWWFGGHACNGRALNFHRGQRQAILNTIVAHEVLAGIDLPDLYRKACPQVMLEDGLLGEVTQARHAHPEYCLKMASASDTTWVLQALLVWQLLNRTVVLDEGREDSRFTRHFLLLAPALPGYAHLLESFLGKPQAHGRRDFAQSQVATCAGLLVPPLWRQRYLQLVRDSVCSGAGIGWQATGNGMIAIPRPQRLAEAGDEAGANVLPFLSGLPDLMVFNDRTRHVDGPARDREAGEVEWQKRLGRIAANKGRRFIQVDFSAAPYRQRGAGPDTDKDRVWFPHVVVDSDRHPDHTRATDPTGLP